MLVNPSNFFADSKVQDILPAYEAGTVPRCTANDGFVRKPTLYKKTHHGHTHVKVLEVDKEKMLNE